MSQGSGGQQAQSAAAEPAAGDVKSPGCAKKVEEKDMAASLAAAEPKAKVKATRTPRRPRRLRREGRPDSRCRCSICRTPPSADDQAGQEARLRHLRAAQRRDAVRGGHLRPDRGRLRDAERDGHQCRRAGGSRRRGDEDGEEPEEEDDERRRAGRGQPKPLATKEKKEPSERTDDPVRMYLREWARSSCCRARAKSRSPSASRPAARR